MDCISCSMVYKMFSCSEFADTSDKAERKARRRRKRTHPNAKRYVFHAKAILLCDIWLDRKYRWNCATTTLKPIHLHLFTQRMSLSRVWQLAYVAYVRTPTFIEVRMILDIRTLTRTLIFSPGFFEVFKIFLILKISYCLKTYCYTFDF